MTLDLLMMPGRGVAQMDKTDTGGAIMGRRNGLRFHLREGEAGGN